MLTPLLFLWAIFVGAAVAALVHRLIIDLRRVRSAHSVLRNSVELKGGRHAS